MIIVLSLKFVFVCFVLKLASGRALKSFEKSRPYGPPAAGLGPRRAQGRPGARPAAAAAASMWRPAAAAPANHWTRPPAGSRTSPQKISEHVPKSHVLFDNDFRVGKIAPVTLDSGRGDPLIPAPPMNEEDQPSKSFESHVQMQPVRLDSSLYGRGEVWTGSDSLRLNY